MSFLKVFNNNNLLFEELSKKFNYDINIYKKLYLLNKNFRKKINNYFKKLGFPKHNGYYIPDNKLKLSYGLFYAGIDGDLSKLKNNIKFIKNFDLINQSMIGALFKNNDNIVDFIINNYCYYISKGSLYLCFLKQKKEIILKIFHMKHGEEGGLLSNDTIFAYLSAKFDNLEMFKLSMENNYYNNNYFTNYNCYIIDLINRYIKNYNLNYPSWNKILLNFTNNKNNEEINKEISEKLLKKSLIIDHLVEECDNYNFVFSDNFTQSFSFLLKNGFSSFDELFKSLFKEQKIHPVEKLIINYYK